MTSTDISAIEHLDFSLEEVCGHYSTGECSRKADWFATCICHEESGFLCDYHYRGYLEYLESFWGFAAVATCEACGSVIKRGNWKFYPLV